MPAAAAAERRSALVVLVLLSLIWGYNWVVMKIGLQYAGPLSFSALRGVVGTAVLFGMLIVTGRSLRPTVIGETLLLGLLQTAGFVGLVQWALVEGGAGRIAVLAYTMPFWTILLAWLLLGERMRLVQWGAVALAGAGLALILQPWNLEATMFSKTLAVAAGLSWAAGVIVAKRLRARHRVDLMSLSTWQLAFGLIPLSVAAWLVPERPVDWSLALLWPLLFAGVLGSGLAWMMWLYVLHRLPAGTAGLNTLAIPVIAVLSAWLQFGERPNGIELAGMAIILLGLALMSIAALREQRRPDPAMAQE